MNENKTQNTLIWIILALNAVTLILITTLTFISWDAITQKTDQPTEKELPAQQQTQETKPIPATTQQQSPEDKTTHGQCGDGVCDAVEKANSGICPQDCK